VAGAEAAEAAAGPGASVTGARPKKLNRRGPTSGYGAGSS
jgi:hypothetical protein